MGNNGSSLSDLNLFSKGGVFTREQLDEYQVRFLEIFDFSRGTIFENLKNFLGLHLFHEERYHPVV